ncbi:MAG: cadmium-translocating P-type ATPase [Oscillospiraceae bacterium]|nr:cadmium-translocating P-type ATPase [Oscillospiraceae bacterium]
MAHEHEHGAACDCCHEHDHHDHHEHGGHCCCHDHDHGGQEGIGVFLLVAGVLFVAGLLLPLGAVLQDALLLASYLLAGWSVLCTAARNIRHGKVFDENFLMAVASIGAVVLGEFSEAAAVMLLYQLGELLQSRAVGASRRTIRALMDVRADKANVLRDGVLRTVEAETVAVGEVIEVRVGERIPLDGTVLDGTSSLDTSALTGESLPREVIVGGEVLAGCVNLSGVLTVRVDKPFAESSSSRILRLVEEAAERKSKPERFITRFARIYTPAVVCAAVLIAVLPPLLGLGAWSVFLHRALTFLVISCPCALVISVPLTFFSGLGCASRNGVLIKGANYLESLARVEAAAFDKTGTLTRGEFTVQSLHPRAGIDAARLLELAAYAEQHSSHPLARSIVSAYEGTLDLPRITEQSETAGGGVRAVFDGKPLLAGKADFLCRQGIVVDEAVENNTCIHVAFDGVYCGAIVLGDTVKEDAREAVAALRRLGVQKMVILSGDTTAAVQMAADTVGIEAVYAQLLPEEKLERLESLQKDCNGILLYAGDGINDAPVLAAADIGVAMGALGTDAAMEAADVVVMGDEPSKIAKAVQVSRRTLSIAKQNIAFSICVKVIFLTLGAFGDMTLWAAVFADVGVCLLAVLNALRAARA